MNTTPITINPEQRMSSREIAEVMDKRHDNVVRDIRELIDEEAIDRLSFEEISYLDAMNREQPAYELNFQATMVLITGYDAKRRAVVIDRWLKLETGEAAPALNHRGQAMVPAEEVLGLYRDTKTLLEENNRLLKQQLTAAEGKITRRRNFTPDEDARILHLRNEGFSIREIGLAVGRKKNSVRSCLRRLRKAGIYSGAN